METLAAVGLAGNILSFVDFSAKLLVSARAIYKSAAEASPENHVLQIIAEDVQFYVENITTTSDTDQHLKTLAEESRIIASDLLGLIHQVSVRDNTILGAITLFVMIFIRWDMDTKVQRWGKLHGATGSHQKKKERHHNALLRFSR
ncbi:hypothetical protein F5Y18DRAFT_422239 [Xylariaceae sp. FL1019]|nr:hypothetical protein F5Y18DRAFT_422239 [Xylariaceae sp. FL1019]